MAEKTAFFEPYSGVTLQLDERVIQSLENGLARKTAVYEAVGRINTETLTGVLSRSRNLPDRLTGRLLAPGARPGARLRIQVPRPSAHRGTWIAPTVITDARGGFEIDLPPAKLPDQGLTLRVEGEGGGSTSIVIPRADLIGNGDVGALSLDRVLTPLPMSVYGTLASYVPNAPADVDEQPDAWAELQPGIVLGEGDCAASIDPDGRAFDRFSYGLLFRIVDPEIWPKILRIERRGGDPIRISLRLLKSLHPAAREAILNLGEIEFDEREPVNEPISVDAFAQSISNDPVNYPKAGTLGLGYVLGMRQSWEPTGFSLGDLIYSLPLAPGEVQRLAVRERRETLAAYERESLSVNERRAFDEAVASTASSVFSSTLNESGAGGTEWDQSSSAGGGGGGFSLFGVSFGGGGGSSAASGTSSGWSAASRGFASSAVDRFNGALSRQSSAARQAARTSMRLATSSDTEETTTRVISNNNRLHALTVQYWEVLRHFSVTTRPDDVSLVVFVPLQLVQWRPSGVPRVLNYSADNVPTRSSLQRRYAMLWRYADRLRRRLPRRTYIRGMRQLRRLMTSPDIKVAIATGQQAAEIDVRIQGSFLPFDEVTVDAIDQYGRRLGRVRLSPTGATPDFGDAIDKEALLSRLRTYRDRATGNVRTGKMVLRTGVDLSRIERFDIRTRVVSYTHTPDPEQVTVTVPGLNLQVTANFDELEKTGLITSPRPFAVYAGELRREVGGPKVVTINVTGSESGKTGTDNLVDPSKIVQEVLPPWLPLPAKPTAPVLTDEQLVRIEVLFQHVLSNPMRYSKAVWTALDADERATMLEAYTIGVPPDSDAAPDQSQEIPLLNCVTNRLLGFFGNSMVLPFHLPPELERARDPGDDGVGDDVRAVSTRDVQEAILQFHREGFQPRRVSVTLPTDGHLAEAVLGTCPSGEKIDLTRFWNWQDGAPEGVRSVDLPTQPGSELIGEAGAEAPGVAAELLEPAIGGDKFVPASPQSPEAILAAALSANSPFLESTIEDVRGMDTLKALMKAALGDGTKPGVDVAAVNGLFDAVAKSAKAKGLKLTDLQGLVDAETKELKEAREKEEKTEADKEAAEKKKEEDAAKKEKEAEVAAEKERQAKIDELIEKAPQFAALIEATPSGQRASAAEAIVEEMVGDDPGSKLTAVQEAALFDAYAPITGNDAKDEAGKAAMRTALGLP